MTSRERHHRRTRILVTGAGGPAAIAAMKSLRADSTVELLAADMDPWAAGLYLVPPDARTLIPPGSASGFAKAMLDTCAVLGVDILVPTVDAELEPLAAARAAFAAAGTELLLAPAGALKIILDKLSLARHCADIVRVPRTEPFGSAFDPGSWTFPVVVKPRRGSGSRGVVIVDSAQALAAIDRSADMIVQEFLPGTEYSIDVLADAAGHVLAHRPRPRARGLRPQGGLGHRPDLRGQRPVQAGPRWLPGAARGEPARPRYARADHRERRRHAQARRRLLARQAYPGARRLP
jgi:carbamoyl-phosphate synthase large subunit